MKNYTILGEHPVGFEDGKTMLAVIIVVDTENDIPKALPTWARGSICLISKGHQFKALNGNGVWE